MKIHKKITGYTGNRYIFCNNFQSIVNLKLESRLKWEKYVLSFDTKIVLLPVEPWGMRICLRKIITVLCVTLSAKGFLDSNIDLRLTTGKIEKPIPHMQLPQNS